MTPNRRRAFNIILFIIFQFAILWISYSIFSGSSEREPWIRLIFWGFLYLIIAMIIFFGIRHLVEKSQFWISILLICGFFVFLGTGKLITPSHADIIDVNTGNLRHAYCKQCEIDGRDPFLNEFKSTYCKFDGTKLIKNHVDFGQVKGDFTTSSPIKRLFNNGMRYFFVAANSIGTRLPITLKKGQRIVIRATGEASGEKKIVKPDGWREGAIFDGRKYVCGASYMALCVKVGKTGWAHCGSSCEFSALEDDVNIDFIVNDVLENSKGEFPAEWWSNNSGGYEVGYIVL